MKKIISLFLAVVMIGSLITVGAAEVATTDVQFKLVVPEHTQYIKDETFDVSLQFKNAEATALASFGAEITYDKTYLSLTNITLKGFLEGKTEDESTGRISGSFTSDQNTGGEFVELATLSFKVIDVAESGAKTISVDNTTSLRNADGDIFNTEVATATATLARTFAVKNAGVTAITEKQPVELGTSVDNVVKALEALEFTVVGDVATDTAKLKATGWTSTTYNADVADDYEFTGTLQAVSPITGFTTAADATVKVTVTVGKITLTSDMIASVATQEIRQNLAADPAEVTTAAAIEMVALPATVAICKPETDYNETATVTWAAKDGAAKIDLTKITEGENAANKVTVVGTVTPAETGNYTGTATIETDIVIIPATIDNASIAIKNNSIYAIPQITITVPAKEIKPDNVVTEGEGEGATEVSRTGVNEIKVTLTQESGDPIVLTASALKYNDFTFSGEGDDAVATYTVTGVKSLNELGVESGEDVTISATLNKAELVVGTEDVTDEEGTVTGTKDVTSVGITASKPISGSAAGIKPGASINNNSQNNQTGTTTPGTETPGTETPGTETPGTETPGTDAPVVEAPFEDVAGDHWAAEAIATLKDAGIVGGVTATTFAPDADITRAEFTKMIAGLLKLDATSTEVAFEDCGADDWFTPYVAAAVEAGLVTGVSETEFAPDATITREQAFTIIGRAIAAAEVNTTLTYADAAEISEYAVPYVTLLTQEGIVGGFADNTVRPQANITRAEAAKVIAGLMGIVVTEEEVAEEEAVEETVEEEAVEEETTEETVEEEAAEELVEDVVEEETAKE